MDCPNCNILRVRNQSGRVYNTSNPYAVGTEYNKPFQDGQSCPVCSSKGTIPTYTNVVGLVNWITSDNMLYESISLTSRRCQIKITKDYYDIVRNASILWVPAINGEFVKCKKVAGPSGLGIVKHNFIVFYVESAT